MSVPFYLFAFSYEQVIGLHSSQPIGFGPFVQRSLALIHRLVFSAESAGKGLHYGW